MSSSRLKVEPQMKRKKIEGGEEFLISRKAGLPNLFDQLPPSFHLAHIFELVSTLFTLFGNVA